MFEIADYVFFDEEDRFNLQSPQFRVAKPLNPECRFWRLYVRGENGLFIFVKKYTFGEIVRSFLESMPKEIVTSSFSKCSPFYDPYQDFSIRIIPRYNEGTIRDCGAFLLSKLKNKQKMTRGELDRCYRYAKDLAYWHDNEEWLDMDYLHTIEEYGLERPYSNKMIIPISQSRVLEDGESYAIFELFDFGALFAIDLKEVLFNDKVSINLKGLFECMKCHNLFQVKGKANNLKYCECCRAQNLHFAINDKELNALRKRIYDLYNDRMEQEKRKQIPDEEKITSLYESLAAFTDQYEMYKHLIKRQIVPQYMDIKYDNTIDTPQRLYNWLKRYWDNLNVKESPFRKEK